MLICERVAECGMEFAIRGMRNPLNSWDKSDSRYVYDEDLDDYEFVIGEKDLKLAQSLIIAGTDHSKFMRMIHIQADIIAPMYWWKEFDTYKVGTTRNSCSTMHTIHQKEFKLSDFAHEYMYTCDSGAPDHYEQVTCDVLETVVRNLNYTRDAYLEITDQRMKKKAWYNLIQMLPSSYMQKSTIDFSYQTARNIYFARRNHKLDEWHEFINEVLGVLPYFKELIAYEGDTKRETNTSVSGV